MKKSSQINLLSAYVEEQEDRSKIPTTGLLDIWLDYCEYSIRSQFDKNQRTTYKNKRRKHQVPQDFKNAIDNINRQEKVQFYIRCVKHLKNLSQGKLIPPITSDKGFLTGQGQTRSYNLKIWKKKQLRLDRSRHYLYGERDKKVKSYDLKDYILRKSKITDKSNFAFVLQAINNKPHQKSRTVHIRFDNSKVYQQWYQNIKISIEYQQWSNIRQMYETNTKLKMSSVTTYGDKQQKYMIRDKNQQKIMSVSQVQPQTANKFDQIEQSYSPTKRFTKGQEYYQKIKPQSQIDNSLALQKKQQLIMKDSPRTNRQNLQKKIQRQEEQIEKQYEKLRDRKKTFIDTLIEDQVVDFEELTDQIQDQEELQKHQKKNLDIFHRLMPDYELLELKQFNNYEAIQIPTNDPRLSIYKNLKQQTKLKIRMQFPMTEYNSQNILSFVSNPSHQFNQNIQEVQIKTMIASQNSAIVYLVLKAYNKLYRPRDFIFVRHVFKNNGILYMIDKSMDNINYPPFMTIVRGELSIIWGIYKNQTAKFYQLIGDLSLTNSGYLNPQQELNLTLKYLNNFSNIYKQIIPKQELSLFSLQWDIAKKDINKQAEQLRQRRKFIKKEKEKFDQVYQVSSPTSTSNKINRIQNTSAEQSPNYKRKEKVCEVYSSPSQFKQNSSQSQGQTYNSGSQKSIKNYEKQYNYKVQVQKTDSFKKIESKKIETTEANITNGQLKTQLKLLRVQNKQNGAQSLSKIRLQRKIVRKLDDKEGLIIVDKNFSSQKYTLSPEDKALHKYLQYSKIEGHHIWKGEWVHDSKAGGIIFTNQKKIEDQKGVLKFILTKIGKNILSGKSVLNISLPVDIFYPESNLERLMISMGYGPKLLQNLQTQTSLIKLSKVIVFGLTNSILYLNMEKPFNPILGQTFQCWINGCPGYGQQISHHPPIAALMFYGRGYRITCQLQSKVQLHMNSGCGINDGIFKVRFDDKYNTEVCFMTPGGQISGLTYGDRKFNIVGKGYYWIQKQNIFIQITYDPHKKGFFSVGKQESPSDYFQGKIYEVKPQFMQSFLKGKKRQPSEKQRLKQLGKIQGVWNKYLKFNDKQIFNLQNDVPLHIQYEKFPLPSDANWREDIQYRRLQQTTRAQTEKERLQVLQRKDRKLREKYHKHK